MRERVGIFFWTAESENCREIIDELMISKSGNISKSCTNNIQGMKQEVE